MRCSSASKISQTRCVQALRKQDQRLDQSKLYGHDVAARLQVKRIPSKCCGQHKTIIHTGYRSCHQSGRFSKGTNTQRYFWNHGSQLLWKASVRAMGEDASDISKGAELSTDWKQAVRVLQWQAEESARQDALFQDTVSDALLRAGGLTPKGGGSVGDDLRTEEQMANALATRYIDDTLLATVANETLDVKQIVFLSSGVETRPYRLQWPASTVFFEVAPPDALSQAQSLVKAAGVSVPRGRMLVRVEAHWQSGGEHWAKQLTRRAYQGMRPSIWVMQGPAELSPHAVVDVLLDIGDLAHAHTVIVGQLPSSALPSETERTPEAVASRLFAEHGFSFEVIDRRKLAQQYAIDVTQVGQDSASQIIFKAVQRRLSQAQLEALQPQIENMEEDRDGEEGFEDLW